MWSWICGDSIIVVDLLDIRGQSAFLRFGKRDAFSGVDDRAVLHPVAEEWYSTRPNPRANEVLVARISGNIARRCLASKRRGIVVKTTLVAFPLPEDVPVSNCPLLFHHTPSLRSTLQYRVILVAAV